MVSASPAQASPSLQGMRCAPPPHRSDYVVRYVFTLLAPLVPSLISITTCSTRRAHEEPGRDAGWLRLRVLRKPRRGMRRHPGPGQPARWNIVPALGGSMEHRAAIYSAESVPLVPLVSYAPGEATTPSPEVPFR